MRYATRRSIWIAIVACVLVSGLTVPMEGSAQIVQATKLRANTAEYEFRPSLHRVISVDLEEVTLGEALRHIAQKANLRVSYSRDVIDPDKIVSLKLEEVSALEALQELMRQEGLRISVSSRGFVVPRKAEIAEPVMQTPAEVQTGTIRGTVVEAETGDLLPGATVLIEETGQGDATGNDGTFEITGVEEGSYTVRFSFVGFESHREVVELAAGATVTLDIALAQSDVGLDALVVTGYSIRPRSQPTGALARVEGDAFREALIQSPDQALQGRMSGVQVTHNSGQPGSGPQVRVRGLGSINASNSPLYIIDGVQVRTDFSSVIVPDNPLATINPNDIESIEVLKDASATALYGAQGANGVVLITTRQAQRGQTQITVSSQTGYNESPPKLLDIMDGPTWTETMIEGYVNYYVDRGQDPEVRRQMAIERYGDPATAPTYDWMGELSRSGVLHSHNVSASTALDNTRIFLSGSYDYEEGPVLASDFSSLRFRSNVDHSFSDRFTIVTRLSASSSVANGLVAGSANINSPFHGGYTQRPIDAIYTEDGGYNHNDVIRVNLVQQLNENIRQATTRQVRGSGTAIYMIRENLSFRSLWGIDYRTVRDRSYTSALLPRYESVGGSVTERYREATSFNTNQVLEFEETFDIHSINLLGGFEYRANDNHSFTASGEQFPNPVFSQLDLAAIESSISGRTSQSRFAGIFSRAEYNFDQKYFVTGSVRYDGSSRFGQQRQWGLFYSGALAWDIVQESFMQRVDFINQLRIRTSYGITGNSGISDFASRSLFGSGGTYDGRTGLRPSGLGNDLLTWEEAQTLDIGLEFAVVGGRFYGDVNWFRTRNKNLLLNAWLPTDSGFSSISRNSGVVENTGWEIDLGSHWIATNTFSWTTDFNFTYQQNEIIELVDGLELLGSSTRVGYPIDILWMNPFAGINPADGRAFWYDADGNLTYTRSSSDQTMLGTYSPDFFGGLTNSFRYGNVSLSAFFQYDYGRTTYNSSYGRRMQIVSTERGLAGRVAADAWKEPGDIAELPRHYTSSSFPGSSSHNHSSLFVKDASYIRLKEVRLNYTLPNRWIEKVSLDNANVFVQGRNVLLWTNYPFGDPEFVGQGTGEYPQSRQTTVGINFQF